MVETVLTTPRVLPPTMVTPWASSIQSYLPKMPSRFHAANSKSAHPQIRIWMDGWLVQAEQSGIAELKSFAQGIHLDYVAVSAAFTSPWSQGQVEAQVNCLKLQKRIVFGRATFDLLRL